MIIREGTAVYDSIINVGLKRLKLNQAHFIVVNGVCGAHEIVSEAQLLFPYQEALFSFDFIGGTLTRYDAIVDSIGTTT
jgi:hypothetical protein